MGAASGERADRRGFGAPPPPPRPPAQPGKAKEISFVDFDEPIPSRGPAPNVGRRFDSELDACELDERERPGPKWTARARELSRSQITFVSRRMCYVGRRILLAVHLVDDQPVPLVGRVGTCDYDGDALYRVVLELEPVPNTPAIREWLLGKA